MTDNRNFIRKVFENVKIKIQIYLDIFNNQENLNTCYRL